MRCIRFGRKAAAALRVRLWNIVFLYRYSRPHPILSKEIREGGRFSTAYEGQAIYDGITFVSGSAETLYILSYFFQGEFGENANRILSAYNTQTGEVRFTTELEFNSYAPYGSFFGKFREGSVIIGETSFGNTYHIDPQTGNAESQLDIMPFDFPIRVNFTTDVEVQGDLEVALGHSLDRCKEARGLG